MMLKNLIFFLPAFLGTPGFAGSCGCQTSTPRCASCNDIPYDMMQRLITQSS